ncbi:MAG: patatin family protein [Candidatus Dadabacteria bacterium]|nr:patatin family protein [Candidatus Dadabacteria bacterium]NIQ13471.1 patatin family protein [Candidatus Dadabacteria bacterium]
MKIGIALGSGGAKGYAAAGVLKGFTEENIKVDYIAGTSIGAFLGAVYSDGKLYKILNDNFRIKLKDIPALLSPTLSKRGLFSGNKVEKLLTELVDVKNIEDLSIPLAVLATDINTSELAVFTKGDLSKAVRASISIPGIFTPVVNGDQLLVDGAFLEPVPVKTVRNMGADIVIAIDLLTGPLSSEISSENVDISKKYYSENVFDYIQRSSIITQKKLIEYSFDKYPPDMVIRPDVSEINTLDFHKREHGINQGYKKFREILPQLKTLINV